MNSNTESKGIPYQTSHPWYYVLGGKVLKPSQIKENVIKSAYQGYLAEDIEIAARKSEPQRSIALRKIKDSVNKRLYFDLSRYREVTRELHMHRKKSITKEPQCDSIHTSLSLKHNHIYNGFAHLVKIDELLSDQPELDLFSPALGGSNAR